MLYKTTKKLIAFTLLSVVFLVGCSDTPEPEPKTPNEVQELNITVNHTFDGNDLVLNNEEYTLPSGESVNFKRLAYLLADFYLLKDNGDTVILDDQYAFINASKSESFTLTDIPMGNYTAVGFYVGLDSLRNHGDPNQWPTNHPLSPINNSLHWSWQGGYIFTAIEGGLAGTRDNFVFHLAGVMNTTTYEIPFSFEKKEAALEVEMEYMLEEVFKNPEVFSLSKDGMSTHSVDHPVSKKLSRNMGDQFSITTVQ